MARKEEKNNFIQEYLENYKDNSYEAAAEREDVGHACDASIKWADETMIKKACEWLRENVTNYEAFDPIAETYYQEVNILIDDFKKAMEE